MTPTQQEDVLRFALYDLARYESDLTDNERAWLQDQLPPAPIEALSPDQRARVAGVVLLVLRRRAGWAA
jgi:hypothetical protein